MDRIAALFDLDRTLLDTSSGQLWARYMHRMGRMSKREMVLVGWWTVLSRLGLLDMQELIKRLLQAAAGDDEAETLRMSDRWFEEQVLPHVARSPMVE